MVNLKMFLGLTVPLAIILAIWAVMSNNYPLFAVGFVYAIIGGIFWKFVKHF